MGMAVKVTRVELTAAELRSASVRCADGAQVRRILALALVLEGKSRSEAASLNGMDRQTLSDWVHRYNAYGIKGLRSRKSPGREPALTAAQKAELRELVIQGPDPAVHKVVRWRRVDLQAEVARRWSIEMHPNTIGAWLGEMGLTRLQPRPVHPKKNAAAEATFKNFASLVRKALNGTTSGTPVEIWFQDEARVGQQGTHAYIGAEPAKVPSAPADGRPAEGPIGSRPRMVRDNRHDLAYIFGAISLRRYSSGYAAGTLRASARNAASEPP
jgi:transposase